MRYLVYIVFALGISSSFAQTLSVKFLRESFNFDKIKEEAGEVSYAFEFINMGADPLAIISVNADCGCTTPSWTEKTLNVGDTGVIVAAYDPYDQPGKFEKNLTVKFSNGEEKILKLTGTVIPREKTDAEEAFPEAMGCLLLKSNYVHLSRVVNNKEKEHRIQFYNNCNKAVVIDKKSVQVPAHLSLEWNADTIEAKSYGSATVIFNPRQKGLGYSRDEISFSTNEESDNEKTLIVTAEVEHHFPEMTAQELADAPKVRFEKLEHEFGVLKEGKKASVKFDFHNEGKNDLEILEVKATCACIEIESIDEKVGKGKKGTVAVTFDLSGRSGKQVKTLIVYTNDPKKPVLTLKVSGKIE